MTVILGAGGRLILTCGIRASVYVPSELARGLWEHSRFNGGIGSWSGFSDRVGEASPAFPAAHSAAASRFSRHGAGQLFDKAATFTVYGRIGSAESVSSSMLCPTVPDQVPRTTASGPQPGGNPTSRRSPHLASPPCDPQPAPDLAIYNQLLQPGREAQQ